MHCERPKIFWWNDEQAETLEARDESKGERDNATDRETACAGAGQGGVDPWRRPARQGGYEGRRRGAAGQVDPIWRHPAGKNDGVDLFFFPTSPICGLVKRSIMPFHYRQLDLAGTPPPDFGVLGTSRTSISVRS
jgi:hypothetical protein